jgi:hypothetical protein
LSEAIATLVGVVFPSIAAPFFLLAITRFADWLDSRDR